MKVFRKVAILAVLFSAVLPFLHAPCQAKDKSSSTVLKGSCCVKGTVVSATEGECRQKGGAYYKSLAEAKSKCQPPDIFCCLDGQVFQLSTAACKKKGGTPYATQAEAGKKCQPPDIFCCKDGKVLQTTPGDCKKRGGMPYANQTAAGKKCRPPDVSCCVDGEVLQLSPGDCKKEGGTPYANPAEARRKCRPPDIFCCLDGKVLKTSSRECAKKKGNPYPDAKTAGQCGDEKGFCSEKGKIKPSTRKKCLQFEGVFSLTRAEALRKAPPDMKIKKLDTSRETERLPEDSVRAPERMVPQPTETMEAQAPPRFGPQFPARIVSANCPRAVGDSLSIHGTDFGGSNGSVAVSLPGETFSCDITEWGDEHVRCTIPISMGDSVGQSAKEAVVWVKPARIDPPAPGTVRHPDSTGESPYYWSGEEGPRHTCMVQPMVPEIDGLSPAEITPLEEVEVEGDNFGTAEGSLRFTMDGKEFSTSTVDWRNHRIRMFLTDERGSSGPPNELYEGETRSAELEITNSAGNSTSTAVTFVPGTENPLIDLRTDLVRITRRTIAGGRRQLLIQVTVENREWGTTYRRIRIDMRGLDMAGWIEDGIGGRQMKTYTFVYDDSHTGDELDFHVVLDNWDEIPETSTSNNECHVNWRAIDTEREYSCITM